MANIKIKEIYRDKVETKYGEKEMIKIVPHDEKVIDVNGDEVVLDGRRVTGFRDKNGETDKWDNDMTIKVQIATNKTEKDGVEKKWVNFRLPEGVSSIVEEASKSDEPVEDPDDF